MADIELEVGSALVFGLTYFFYKICLVAWFLTIIPNFCFCHEKNIENEDPKQLQIKTKTGEVNKSRSFPSDLSEELNSSTNSTSTPKVAKVNSESSVLNLTSPISPIYKIQNSFSTPKSNKSAICLGDYIIDRRLSSKKKSVKKFESDTKRRIKPTNLLQQNSSSFNKTENSFDFNNSDFEELPRERTDLVEERLKILNRTDHPVKTPTSKILTYSFNDADNIEIKPNIQFVTYKRQIDEIINIYKVLIDENLVLNLASEVYFFTSLLIKKQFNTRQLGVDILHDEILTTHIFKSIHNVTYFAANGLKALAPILENYDKASIRLLTENVRLCNFVPDLIENLRLLHKIDKIIEIENLQDNVCFDLDTDNRQNFPNELSFHAFRKQRDLFYEILRIWEIHHLSPSFNFLFSLGGKIQSLFLLSNETTNFIHFARLFKAQLLGTCHSKDCDNFLTSLEIDAQKLSRLRNRCVTRENPTEITPLPQFSGSEEFYKDFILVAGNYVFNRHLTDVFIKEILELNDTSFNCNEFSKGEEVDFTTKKSYYFCIKSLRLLGKFLGFLEALPYKSEHNFTENLVRNHIKIRQMIVPNLNLKYILQKSIECKTVTLCIPWLVKYLSMLDYVTLSLPYYTAIYNILFWLYRNFNWAPHSNTYLIKFTLGWLFHLSHVPDRNYMVFDSEFQGRKEEQKQADNTTIYLDELQVIDHNILYLCCPYLEEIKKLLSSTVTSNTLSVKHITPVTALNSPDQIAKKKIQAQLEEAFFNGQPVSLKKTVEFVSERVASVCVKHICHTLVPQYKKNALEKLRNSITIDENDDMEVQKSVFKSKSLELAALCIKELQIICDSEIEKIASSRIQSAMESLVGLDILPQTKKVCVSLSKRSCIERVTQWVTSHVTLGIFLKEFNDELQKLFSDSREKILKPIFLLPPCGSNDKHDVSKTSAAHLVEKYRDLCLYAAEHKEIVRSVLVGLLDDTVNSVEQRGDINQCILATLCSQILDLCILLLASQPKLVIEEEIFLKCCQIWKLYDTGAEDLFKSLLCLRNVEIFSHAEQPTDTWNAFAKVCNKLIRHKLLTCDHFESQCTGLFKTDWDEVTLNYITHFLRTFVRMYNDQEGSKTQFTFLLDFLSEFCEDLF